MAAKLSVEFDRRPSAFRFMLNALRTSPGLSSTGRVPPIVARWREHRVDERQLAAFLELTGLRPAAYLPMIYPHVFGFRLQMVILTHPAFPFPIWGALQIRNRLLQHRPIPSDSLLDLETCVAGHRILQKGAEVDLHTKVSRDGEPIWESLVTYYYRGQFGPAEAASTLGDAPGVPAPIIAQWHLPPGVGWRLARMTGDYNGIHRWHWYARLLGFPRAFFHSQMVVGQCMAHLPPPDREGPQRLDLWLKGPVFFDSAVSLRAAAMEQGVEFALMLDRDNRPAILGRWRMAGAWE